MLNTEGTVLVCEDLVNSLIVMLEIDNITENAAHPGVTNAGGFVSVQDHPVTARDVDPYLENAVYVTWIPEENWLFTDGLIVRYQEHGEEDFTTITVDDYTDLTALKDRFPEAKIEILSTGARRLILASDPSTMPAKTHVDVSFVPTIAVENTTLADADGTVSVSNGSVSNDKDGRYEEFTVYGYANEEYRVDLKNLQIGGINSVASQYLFNFGAVAITPDENGHFSATLTLPIAGKQETVTVSGTVTVLAIDTYGHATQVAITVNSLPSCLDIGIPFVRSKDPSIAQTGDPIHYAIAFTGVSGLALLILLLVDKRKKKQRS